MGLLSVFLIGLVPCVIAWRLTRRSSPWRAAIVRSAVVTLFFVPGFAPAPSLHGAFPVPAWMLLIWGPKEVGIAGTLSLLSFPPGVAFILLALLFRAVAALIPPATAKQPTE